MSADDNGIRAPSDSGVNVSLEALNRAAQLLDRDHAVDERLDGHDQQFRDLAYVHSVKKWAIGAVGSAFAALGVAVRLAYGYGVSSTASNAAHDREMAELRYRLQTAEQALADLRALLPVRIVLPPTQSNGGTVP